MMVGVADCVIRKLLKFKTSLYRWLLELLNPNTSYQFCAVCFGGFLFVVGYRRHKLALLVSKCLRGPDLSVTLSFQPTAGRCHLRSDASGRLDVSQSVISVGRRSFAVFSPCYYVLRLCSRTASLDAVKVDLRTTSECVSVWHHWMACAYSASEFI